MTEAPLPEGFTPEAPTPDSQEAARTLTWEEHQAELKRVGSKEKKEGRTAREKDLLEKAGAESLDEVIAAYQAQKQVEAEMESAADKAEKAKAKAEERAQAAEERYTNTLRTYAIKDAFRDSGINPERMKAAMRLADMSALEVDGNGEVSGIEDVVAAVQEESPEWFGSTEPQAPRRSADTSRQPISRASDPNEGFGNWLIGVVDKKL
jgi:hypothetical protein